MASEHHFQTADYLVFSATLVLSIGIGVYYAVTGGKQRTTSEFLLAGRKMHFLPVAISMFVTYKSSILMLGYPAEAYVYGLQIFVRLAPHLLANLLSVWMAVPLIYPLKITSINELWYMGIVLYGPAIALKAVTGFPLWISISGMAFVSMIYTSIGGMKAVIWTDVLQTFVMFGGIFAVLIKGTIDVGGAKAVWDTAKAGGRINIFNFDLDPTVRHTFWNLCITGFVRGFDSAFAQTTIQRVGSTTSMKDAKRVMLFEGPASFIVCVLALYEGLVSYAYYSEKGCDPFKSGRLTNPNQIIPLLVMDLFKSPFGLAGLFVASLFSACLRFGSAWISTRSQSNLSQVIASGLLACGVAWLTSLVGGPLQQISAVLLTASSSPQIGIFFLACYSPRSNAKGVIIGGILSILLCTWISLGMSFTPGLKRTPYLPPAPMDKCAGQTNATSHWTTNDSNPWATTANGSNHWVTTVNGSNPWATTANGSSPWVTTANPLLENLQASVDGSSSGNTTEETGVQGIEKIYTISYTWIPLIGIGSSMFFGYIFSILTGSAKPGEVDPRYLVSFSDSFLIFLPKRIRRAIKSWGTHPIVTQEYDIGEISSTSNKLNEERALNPSMHELTTPMDNCVTAVPGAETET